MKSLACLLVLLAAFTACTNNTPTENQNVIKEENTLVDTVKKITLETGCYMYEKDGNMIRMHITEVDGHVAGDLNISYAEKDKNKGKFLGVLHGDKLIGVYTFYSEGIESSRQIAFLVKDNQLIEGYGELDENGTTFKDVNAIEYTSTMPLSKVDCDNLTDNCKPTGSC